MHRTVFPSGEIQVVPTKIQREPCTEVLLQTNTFVSVTISIHLGNIPFYSLKLSGAPPRIKASKATDFRVPPPSTLKLSIHLPAMYPPTKVLLVASLLLAGLTAHARAAAIVQTAGQSSGPSDWNSADWGTPAATPTTGNTYITNAALGGSTDGTFGVNTTSYLRIFDVVGGTNTFGGDSIEDVSGERLLDKAGPGDGVAANLILDSGSLFEEAANAAGTTFLNGTINVPSGTGVATIGVNQTGASTLNINATLTGTGMLNLAGSNGLTPSTMLLNGSINIFSGTISTLTVGTYGITTNAMALNAKLSLTTGTFDLSNNLTVGGLTVGKTTFAPGTYTAALIDSMSGTSVVVDTSSGGMDTITVVPEPGTWVIGLVAVGGLALQQLRRRQVM